MSYSVGERACHTGRCIKPTEATRLIVNMLVQMLFRLATELPLELITFRRRGGGGEGGGGGGGDGDE
jgi:hypothetical protein